MNVDGVLEKDAAGSAQIYQRAPAGDDLVQLGLEIVIVLKNGNDFVENLIDRAAQSSDVRRSALQVVVSYISEGICGEGSAHPLRDQVKDILPQCRLTAVDLTAAQTGGVAAGFQRKIPEHFPQWVGDHLDAQQHGGIIGVQICAHCLPPA